MSPRYASGRTARMLERSGEHDALDATEARLHEATASEVTAAEVVALPIHETTTAAPPGKQHPGQHHRKQHPDHRHKAGMLACRAVIDGKRWYYGVSAGSPVAEELARAQASARSLPNKAGRPDSPRADYRGGVGFTGDASFPPSERNTNDLDSAEDLAGPAGAIASIVEGSFGIDYPRNPQQDLSGIWAVNLHGFFAGGRAYWRESSLLASSLGWNLLNPSLPGFGGTDPLPKSNLSIEAMAHGVASLMDHLKIDRALMIGHSMGGAVAIKFAHDYPERTLGVLYRDGIATSAWKHRRGIVATLSSPLLSRGSEVLDIAAAAVLDLPDLLVGHIARTARSLLPDTSRNMLMLHEAFDVATMLYASDLSNEVIAIGCQPDLPLLPIWGCFDRVSNAHTASEFERLSRRRLLWVPGGHSWMLARPSGQVEILRWHSMGRDFLSGVKARMEA